MVALFFRNRANFIDKIEGFLEIREAESARKLLLLHKFPMGQMLGSIDTSELIGLRDRALIALMGYTFARVGAAVAMKVEDYYIQKRRGWVRLHEKGGKVNELSSII